MTLDDLIPIREYARARNPSRRTVCERARQGTLKLNGKRVAWFKGGRWMVHKDAQHWPNKRGRKA